MDTPSSPFPVDLAEAAAEQPPAQPSTDAGRPTGGLAVGGVLQRLEMLARQELRQMSGSGSATLADPMLAGLCWDLGLDGERALEVSVGRD